MQQVRFTCPDCGTRNAAEISGGGEIGCQGCERRWPTQEGAADGRIATCLICRRQLFWRKDFPQKLGLSIVAAGIVLSSLAWSQHWPMTTIAILLASAALDGLVYYLVGEVLVCYRCRAEYRGAAKAAGQGAFDLAVAERYRQEEIRLRSLEDGSK